MLWVCLKDRRSFEDFLEDRNELSDEAHCILTAAQQIDIISKLNGDMDFFGRNYDFVSERRIPMGER